MQAGQRAGHVSRGQLPRPGGQAVLRRPVRLDSAQVDGKWTRLATYPAGAHDGAGAVAAVGPDREDGPEDGGGVSGDAVADLHHDDDLHSGGRRRQRAGAHQLARRHLQPGLHRQSAPGLDHRPRDLPRLEREAAAAGRPLAVRLRAAAADDLALGERGHHRLLRRPGAGARRRRGFGAVPRAHRREDGPGRRRSRRPRWRTRRSPPGSIRSTARSTCTIPRARSPASCWTC